MEPPLTNLVVSPEAMAGIEGRLKRLVREAGASGALFLDHGGQLIRGYGDLDGREVTLLGALLAGNFASAREIAKLLHEPIFRVTFQQGEREHVLTSLVGDKCLLSVFFPMVAQLGLVKMLSAGAADDLAIVIEAAYRQQLTSRVDTSNLRIAAEHGIDELFRESAEEGHS